MENEERYWKVDEVVEALWNKSEYHQKLVTVEWLVVEIEIFIWILAVVNEGEPSVGIGGRRREANQIIARSPKYEIKNLSD